MAAWWWLNKGLISPVRWAADGGFPGDLESTSLKSSTSLGRGTDGHACSLHYRPELWSRPPNLTPSHYQDKSVSKPRKDLEGSRPSQNQGKPIPSQDQDQGRARWDQVKTEAERGETLTLAEQYRKPLEQRPLVTDLQFCIIRIRKGFNRHESLHRQGIYFGRKVHTFNI